MPAPAPAADRQNLLPAAALVSLLVLLLGAAGLFALSFTNQRAIAAQERLGRFNAAEITAVTTQVSFKTQVQEWKDILLRGHNPADYTTYLAHFTRREADVQAGLASLKDQLAALGLDDTAAAQLVADHAALGAAYRKALATYEASNHETTFTVDASIRGIDRKLNNDIDTLARSVEAARNTEFAFVRTTAETRYAKLRKITLGFSALAVLAAFWLVFSAFRSAGARTA